ncbi:MAG: hypothetical protein NT050_03500, partial [Verrucomicrobia bacterium]|nr:hypothetical protein [Verrucomicrobiota bacterium]
SPGEWRIRFYKNDGALENASIATSQKPNTQIWDSGLHPVQPGYQMTTLAVPQVTVPDRFTWTVEFFNLPQDSNNGAGLVLANPPTIGATLPGKNSTVIGSYTDFWMLEEADLLDSWTLQIFSTNPNVGPQGNFFAQVVTAANPNKAPVWTSAAQNRRVSEGSSLSFQLRATDSDLPPQPLSYRLISGPTGLTVSTNGVVSWRPTEEQGPSTNRVWVDVNDGIEGTSQEFDIVVQEQNLPPVWTPVGTRRVTEGLRLSFQLKATDSDLPAQRLTYQLVSGPTGLTVTTNGLLSWTPTVQQGPSTNRVRVSVKDPFTSVTQDVDIIVRDTDPAPAVATLEISSKPGGAWNLHLRATSGVSYQIEQSTSLGGTWAPLPGVSAVVGKSLSEAVTIPLPSNPATNLFLRARRL